MKVVNAEDLYVAHHCSEGPVATPQAPGRAKQQKDKETNPNVEPTASCRVFDFGADAGSDSVAWIGDEAKFAIYKEVAFLDERIVSERPVEIREQREPRGARCDGAPPRIIYGTSVWEVSKDNTFDAIISYESKSGNLYLWHTWVWH